MRETILITALEEIKKKAEIFFEKHGNKKLQEEDEVYQIVTKALTDYASAPESGGEEKLTWDEIQNKVNDERYILSNEALRKLEDCGFEIKRITPNKSTPSTSSNSIEEEEDVYVPPQFKTEKLFFRAICKEDAHEWGIVVQTATGQPQKQWTQCLKCGALPNKEQEDKLSVATKMPKEPDAGNQEIERLQKVLYNTGNQTNSEDSSLKK